MKRLLCLLVCSVFVSTAAGGSVGIVPKPLEMKCGTGSFELNEKTVIGYGDGQEEYALYLKDVFDASTGFDIRVVSSVRKADIRIMVDSVACPLAESYSLEVGKSRISLTAGDRAGVWYGIQTLLQLFPSSIYSDTAVREIWTAPVVSIYDAPQRPWRGMMLDVARYFFDASFVKKYIDMMSMYKLNKLQLHLIDDSGWRLEIKKYPRLTQVGAFAGDNSSRLGGYYTQEEIRDIVKYASFRNVEVIPEIEFPAHILSAVVAYPWLSCTGEQHELPVQHFISRDLLCAGNPKSMEFLRDVLAETVSLFPSEYVNIGGDEAVYDRWKECPKCQALIRREGLSDVSELQGYLTNVVSDMLRAEGKTAVGWEEIILRGEVRNPVVSLFWHSVNDTASLAGTPHKGVVTPATHTYFDFPESATPGEVKAAKWMPYISLEKCYSLPVDDYSSSSSVIGVQGCLWSDQFIHGTVLQEIPLLDENRSENYAEYMTFPRLLALSEVAWTSKGARNFEDFKDRLSAQFPKLDRKHCNYRVPEPEIVSVSGPTSGHGLSSSSNSGSGRTSGHGLSSSSSSGSGSDFGGGVVVELASGVVGSVIRYTTDGQYPNPHSALYYGPITVSKIEDLRASTFVTSRHFSLPTYPAPDYSAYSSYGQFVASWDSLQVVSAMDPSWRIDATGLISGNGQYEASFLVTGGSGIMCVKSFSVLKNGWQIAVCDSPGAAGTLNSDSAGILDPDSPVIPALPSGAIPSRQSGSQPIPSKSSSRTIKCRFRIDNFEAGTPFQFQISITDKSHNKTSGLLFLNRISQD